MSHLVQRIAHRKIVRWALAYFAGAWVLLQVMDFLGGHFAWPGVIVRIATVVLAIGLLAVLVLAWYHGEKGEQRVGGIEIIMLAGILLLSGIGLTAVLQRSDAKCRCCRPLEELAGDSECTGQGAGAGCVSALIVVST